MVREVSTSELADCSHGLISRLPCLLKKEEHGDACAVFFCDGLDSAQRREAFFYRLA